MYLILKAFCFPNNFVDVHEVELLIKTSLSIEKLLTFITEHLHGGVSMCGQRDKI